MLGPEEQLRRNRLMKLYIDISCWYNINNSGFAAAYINHPAHSISLSTVTILEIKLIKQS